MSRRVVQLCVVWLLAFSLPLQGVAATAKACCWKFDIPVSAVVPVVVHDESHADCHEEGASSSSPQATLSPKKAPSHTAGHGQCKPCANCAAGLSGAAAYVPALMVDFTAPAPSATVPASFVNHIGPSLDRPPKHFPFLP